jgi:hypothetical protein
MHYLITWTDVSYEMLELTAADRDTAILAACRLSAVTRDRAVVWECHGEVDGQQLLVHVVGYVNGELIEA